MLHHQADLIGADIGDPAAVIRSVSITDRDELPFPHTKDFYMGGLLAGQDDKTISDLFLIQKKTGQSYPSCLSGHITAYDGILSEIIRFCNA